MDTTDEPDTDRDLNDVTDTPIPEGAEIESVTTHSDLGDETDG